MFTVAQRESLRSELLRAAQADPRITGGAITGSATFGKEDHWSDVDLAFGVREEAEVRATLSDLSEVMYRDYHALHHLDVTSGTWIYRVFILPNTLQVDLAFAPASEFGARAPTFRLVFGSAVALLPLPAPTPEAIIGWAWLYALHARSSIVRSKLWQAEYMISGMRDQVLALACLRHGLPTAEGRGMDALPVQVTAPLQDALVRSLTSAELVRAFRVVINALIHEMQQVAPDLANRLAPTLEQLTEIPPAMPPGRV